jgi:hypothetical protein
MRISPWSCALLAAATLALSPTGLHADELLVLPYACAVVGGRPLLTPSQDEGHRVVGRREQREFTACSPSDPDMCRRWTVHRFDLDCGGQRVPWAAIVAGMQDGRAWLEDGRLHVRMPPRWDMAPDDPCARLSDYEDRWEGRWPHHRLRRYCAQRRLNGPPASVAMPNGFAPMLGIDGVFVAAAPPGPIASSPNPSTAPPSVTREAPQRASRPEPPSDDLPPPEPAKPPVKAPVAAKPPPAERPQAAAVQAPPPSSAAPVVPRIINRPEPERADPPVVPAPATEASKPVATAEPPKPDVVHRRALPMAASTPKGAEGNAVEVTLVSVLQSPVAIGAVAFAGLVMLALAVVLLRRGDAETVVAVRDFASISLDGGRAPGRQVVPMAAAADGAMASAHAPAAVGAASIWGDAMPRTRADALAVLGIGVTPAATTAAIKKVVDGLRQSWHPDYASDPADRQLREMRLKQVNAAWEILAHERAQT